MSAFEWGRLVETMDREAILELFGERMVNVANSENAVLIVAMVIQIQRAERTRIEMWHEWVTAKKPLKSIKEEDVHKRVILEEAVV